MIDIGLIRRKTEKVRTALSKRMDHVDFSEVLGWDKERRELIFEIDSLREKRNRVSSQVPLMKKEGKDVVQYIKEMKTVSKRIKDLNLQLLEKERKIKSFLEALPNIPDDDVPEGGKENNEVIRSWGKKPEFSFKPQNHVDLVKNLDLVDYERGVKLGGSGFWLYKSEGARLEWALLNYFVEEHLMNGYEFILPPHILVQQCGFTAGQFPKFADDVFCLKQPKGKSISQFLLPTGETALTSLHRDEILRESLECYIFSCSD